MQKIADTNVIIASIFMKFEYDFKPQHKGKDRHKGGRGRRRKGKGGERVREATEPKSVSNAWFWELFS